MKYIFFLFPFLFILGIIYYIFPESNHEAEWKLKRTLISPDKNVVAQVKCLNNGGTTVGFYCKLFFFDKNGNESEMMMVRTDDIRMSWITSNILGATVHKRSKIYDFNSVYWNDIVKNEYFVQLEYK